MLTGQKRTFEEPIHVGGRKKKGEKTGESQKVPGTSPDVQYWGGLVG